MLEVVFLVTQTVFFTASVLGWGSSVAIGNIVTTHTINKIPFIISNKKVKLRDDGNLSNVAPTILKYMDIALPQEMKDTKDLFIEE